MTRAGALTSAQWDRAKTIFPEALEQPAGERAAFVSAAAAGDADVEAEVLSLLAAHHEDFLETPAAAMPGALPDALPNGGRVGRFRLLREIGRGGMGTVYLGARDDGEFRHQVAVKLVKRGMDSDLIVARFRNERQILAALDHPNIARIIDGGTADSGQPYFVMEYVDGESIRDYCTNGGLSVVARLALFRLVCSAVQYAHQNLIVHRDIKASNILVTRDGTPKLLDFGIAKLLEPDREGTDDPTVATVQALTPEYASPEQIRGEPVTTATDVYSLGVLLYELLSGRRPYEVRGSAIDVARIVCDTQPPAPSMVAVGENASNVRRQLRGDLDTIVAKAMHKDPQRRYGAVQLLADDLRRYEEGRPVEAQRDSLSYRARKFMQRNRGALVAAALVLVSLVGGLATTTWQARVAREQRARAQRQFAEVRSLATSFLFELHDAIVTLPGATPARALLVKRALASLDALSADAPGDPALEHELAVAYQKVGDVQGNGYNSNLGDTKGALASYRKSIALLGDVSRLDSANAGAAWEFALGHQKLAEILISTGDLHGALAEFERALAMHRDLARRNPKEARFRMSVAEVLNEMGDTQGQEGIANIGDVPGALRSYGESVRVREGLFRESPTSVEARVGLANSLMNQGYLASANGDTTGITQIQRSVALLESVVEELPNDEQRRVGLGAAYARLRLPLVDAGRFSDAVAADRKAVSIMESLLAGDQSNALLRRNLGATYNNLGRDLRAAGDAKPAIALHRKALALSEALAASDASNLGHRHDVAWTRYLLGEALAAAGDRRGALPVYRTALQEKERLRVAEPDNARHGDDLALLNSSIGAVLTADGAYAAAAESYGRAIEFAEAARKRGPAPKPRVTLALIYAGAGAMHADWSATERGAASAQHCAQSRALYEQSLALWKELTAGGRLPAVHRSRADDIARAMDRCGA